MHELGLTTELTDLIVERARAEGASRVLALTVEVGAMSGVDADALSFCFRAVSQGTVAQGAQLHIAHVPLRLQCDDCGDQTDVVELALLCPGCGSSSVRVVRGRELKVTSMEIA